MRQTFKLLNVAFLAASVADAFQNFQHALAAFTAGCAFAAALRLGEGQEEAGQIHHAGVFVHHYQTAGPHHGPRRGKGVVVHRAVQKGFRQARAGGTADLHGLEFLSALDAGADVKDDLAHGSAHGHFNQTGIGDLAGQGEDLGAG